MKKIAAFSYASDLFKDYGKMIENSFKYYHPDIPFYLYKDSIDKRFGFWVYEKGLELSQEYETVIKLDSDNIICGRLTELFGDYEVAASLNDAGITGTEIYFHDIKPEDYMTCSIVAVKNPRFWKHWMELTEIYDFPLYDNDTFNIAFYYGGYKTRILDRESYFYGSSSRTKWTQFIVNGDRILCDGRTVKIMHRAGGSSLTSLGVKENTYRQVGFTEDVCRYFDKITK